MTDFTIRYVNDGIHQNGFCLAFNGIDGTCLLLKNMTFLQEQSDIVDSADVALDAVYIHENETLHFFQYPNPDIQYTAAKFEIKQSGEKGWVVNVDLNAHKIDIKKSPYQII